MKLLGINISHEFSICVYENNVLKDVWYEDRFNFVKHWFPENQDSEEFKHHLISVFNKINFKPDVVCYSSFYRTNDYTLTDYDIINNIQKQLDNPKYFFNIYHHHIYHALCSFYFSKFDEAMSIVIDGGGTQPFDDQYQEMESIFYLNKKLIYLLYQHLSNRRYIRALDSVENYSEHKFIKYKNNTEYHFTSESVGGFDFARTCDLIGYKGGKDSGKLMGLASYADTDIQYLLNYEHVRLAKKVQEKSFIATCKLIEKAYEYKKIKNFVLSGGYFLNCSNNFKYIKKYPEFNFSVDPIPHDGGTAVGACVYYDKYK
jgi:predicted NodU family carbamoyl transferase